MSYCIIINCIWLGSGTTICLKPNSNSYLSLLIWRIFWRFWSDRGDITLVCLQFASTWSILAFNCWNISWNWVIWAIIWVWVFWICFIYSTSILVSLAYLKEPGLFLVVGLLIVFWRSTGISFSCEIWDVSIESTARMNELDLLFCSSGFLPSKIWISSVAASKFGFENLLRGEIKIFTCFIFEVSFSMHFFSERRNSFMLSLFSLNGVIFSGGSF